MSYAARLLEAKASYPFDKWRKRGDNSEGYGLEQYTGENCSAAEKILDDLLSRLADLGEYATEEAKLQKFQASVEAFNALDESTENSLIETEEREELCEIFNVIAVKAGLDPKQYGDGEGPASEWRNW